MKTYNIFGVTKNEYVIFKEDTRYISFNDVSEMCDTFCIHIRKITKPVRGMVKVYFDIPTRSDGDKKTYIIIYDDTIYKFPPNLFFGAYPISSLDEILIDIKSFKMFKKMVKVVDELFIARKAKDEMETRYYRTKDNMTSLSTKMDRIANEMIIEQRDKKLYNKEILEYAAQKEKN